MRSATWTREPAAIPITTARETHDRERLEAKSLSLRRRPYAHSEVHEYRAEDCRTTPVAPPRALELAFWQAPPNPACDCVQHRLEKRPGYAPVRLALKNRNVKTVPWLHRFLVRM